MLHLATVGIALVIAGLTYLFPKKKEGEGRMVRALMFGAAGIRLVIFALASSA